MWIPKGDLGEDAVRWMKQKLTIKPKIPPGYSDEKPKPVKCWAENDLELGVPRDFFFSTSKKQYSLVWELNDGTRASYGTILEQKGKYAEQGEAIQTLCGWFRGANDTGMESGLHLGATFKADPGFGKCLGKGTNVFMYDGSVVPVESVTPGDLLMGPDGLPREVLSTNRGTGEMFRIIPNKGDAWECNDVHMMTLVHSVTGDVGDIPLDEYLRLPNKEKLKLFRPERGVELSGDPGTDLDPYLVGIWIGDGTKTLTQVGITNVDEEVVSYLHEEAGKWGCVLRNSSKPPRVPTYRFTSETRGKNRITDAMRSLFGDDLFSIPESLLKSTIDVRMRLLAGIVDSDGHLAARGGTIEIVQKRLSYVRGIKRLANGLGFSVTVSEKEVGDSVYYRILVSGHTDAIPVKVERKKPGTRRQKKNPSRTGFEVAPIGAGEYYGFTLSGDGRFLLGDCTVTHNTNTALAVAHELAITTVVLVHKESLMTQWVKRAERFMPGIKVGVVQGDTCDFEGKDLVVAMMQSLAMERHGPRYSQEFYNYPGLLVVDEGHRVGSQTWAPVPALFPARWRLLCTATPRRKDGADKVFWWHVGPIRFDAKTERPKPAVRIVESGLRKVPEYLQRPGVSPSLVVNFLTKSGPRNDVVVSEMVKALKAPAKRKLLILSERLEQLRDLDQMLARACEKAGLDDVTTGFYVGEWYTGEVQEKLSKATWKMDDGGREKAVDVLFKAFKRKKDLDADMGGDGERLIYAQPSQDEAEQWIDLDAEMDELETIDDPKEKKRVTALFDKMIFYIAKQHKIRQKRVEKKKALTEEQLAEAERARVVFMTYQMSSEGIDIPAADTLGFVSPISDVEQSYGRGRRECVPKAHGGDRTPDECEHYCPWRHKTCRGKPEPRAFDVVDEYVQLSVRRRQYREEFYDDVGAIVRES